MPPVSNELAHVGLKVDPFKGFLQRLSPEGRIVPDNDLREKDVLLRRFPLATGDDVGRREPVPHGKQVERTGPENDETKVRELGHRKGLSNELLGDAAASRLVDVPMSVSMPPRHRRVGERQEELRRRGAVLVGEVAHHRQQNGDRRGVVDDARERAHESHCRAELLVHVLAGVERRREEGARTNP